jgi:hypothetical protein
VGHPYLMGHGTPSRMLPLLSVRAG